MLPKFITSEKNSHHFNFSERNTSIVFTNCIFNWTNINEHAPPSCFINEHTHLFYTKFNLNKDCFTVRKFYFKFIADKDFTSFKFIARFFSRKKFNSHSGIKYNLINKHYIRKHSIDKHTGFKSCEIWNKNFWIQWIEW